MSARFLLVSTVLGTAALANADDAGVPAVLPLEKPAWRRAVITDISDWSGGTVERGEQAKQIIDQALRRRGDDPVIPGLFPISLGDLVCYRSYLDVRSVHSHAFKKRAYIVKAGEICWKSTELDGALAPIWESFRVSPYLKQWHNRVPPDIADSFVLENALQGDLSSDGRQVYCVDNFAVPLLRSLAPGERANADEFVQNKLHAYQVATGKIMWWGDALHLREFSSRTPWRHHYLNAPLIRDDRLLVLNETNDGELRLKFLESTVGKETASIALDKTAAADRFVGNFRRGLQPARLACVENMLVCAAHTGKFFGVDLESKKLRWTYNYRPEAPAAPVPLAKPVLEGGQLQMSVWKRTAALAHAGKVILTAADDSRIFVVDPHTGQSKTFSSANDLYLAGAHAGRMLLVGQESCRVLDINDGREVWRLNTGVPSGVGTFADGFYYLPLRKGVKSQRPEICVLDVAKGSIAATCALPDDDVPGNLLLHRDLLISQNASHITAYPVEKLLKAIAR